MTLLNFISDLVDFFWVGDFSKMCTDLNAHNIEYTIAIFFAGHLLSLLISLINEIIEHHNSRFFIIFKYHFSIALLIWLSPFLIVCIHIFIFSLLSHISFILAAIVVFAWVLITVIIRLDNLADSQRRSILMIVEGLMNYLNTIKEHENRVEYWVHELNNLN